MAKVRLLWSSLFLIPLAWSQHRVDFSATHERIMCVVPMIGSGTWADPKRPMFAPHGSQIGRDKSGILGYYHELSDDGKSAIVVFVAQDPSAFKAILSAAKTNPAIKVFDRKTIGPPATTPGSQAPAGGLQASTSALQVATNAFTAVRKDFDWQRFAVRVP